MTHCSTSPIDWGCVFCERSFESLEALAIHMIGIHNYQTVQIGNCHMDWKHYRHSGKHKVRCFCGKVYPCDQVCAPAFADWAVKHMADLDGIVNHLRREKGARTHLEMLRQQWIMNKVWNAGMDSVFDQRRTPWNDLVEETTKQSGTPKGGIPGMISRIIDEMNTTELQSDGPLFEEPTDGGST
jgi:hypothetical protein